MPSLSALVFSSAAMGGAKSGRVKSKRNEISAAASTTRSSTSCHTPMPGATQTARVSTSTPTVSGLYALAMAYVDQTDRWLAEIPALSTSAETLGMRPIHLPIALTCLGFLFLGRLEDLILGVVGFFYPAWSSFKAIEKNDSHETVQWLSYWVVYAAFSFIEIFSDFVLFWIPFYYILKLLFLFWLFLPQYQVCNIHIVT
eukprot:Protomagalhaensia_sp_Gyna_25__1785@NODE_193_length_4530_cov_387_349811_g144_i1_p5_GENE_NODE_193_length_4530_cov_387_349811_g144_i1NODE_193_length_4530_cov_387_349811_g144_i1_p5_ORF_typecomplete_len200_score20_78TB2_DP1_HVA22/PF03134_19/2e22_NODE_193_length_4530_cov_387_349811_g144_i116882287